MSSWRKDIETIAKNLTGKNHGSWRANLNAIGGGNNWRGSIRKWAAGYGIPAAWWGSDLIRIAKTVTGDWPANWRDALRMLAMFDVSGTQTQFLLTTLPQQSGALYKWLDNEAWDDNLFWVGG